MLFKEGYSSLSRKPSVESPDECGSTLFTSANRIVHQNGHNSFHCINTDSNLSMESSQSSTSILDIHKGKPIRLQVKVLVPVQDHPNFNFVGKLLGPKGNSLKWLQEETLTKMAILGKGSMRDKEKEEELRKTGDAKYSHLNEELHVDITAFAPAPEAYSRIGHALHEVKRFLVPDYYDDIRQQQLRELGVLSTDKKPGNISRVRGEPIKGESSLNGFLRPAAGPNFSTTTESSPLELSEVNGRPLRPFSGFNQKPKYCPHSNFQISHINEENHPDSNGSWNNNKIMSRINRDNFRSVRPYPKTFIHNYP